MFLCTDPRSTLRDFTYRYFWLRKIPKWIVTAEGRALGTENTVIPMFRVLSAGGPKGWCAGAGLLESEAGPDSLWRRDDQISHSGVLDLLVQSGEALPVRLRQVRTSKVRPEASSGDFPTNYVFTSGFWNSLKIVVFKLPRIKIVLMIKNSFPSRSTWSL